MSYPVRWKDETEKAGTKLTFSDVLKNEELLETYISGLTVPELIRLAVCAGDGWGMEGIGEAGRIYQLEEENIPQFVVADGNSGVNLRKPNIGMLSGATICASFNRELAAQIGQVIGEEAKELGVDLILAPAFNIHRNPCAEGSQNIFLKILILQGQWRRIIAGDWKKQESAVVTSIWRQIMRRHRGKEIRVSFQNELSGKSISRHLKSHWKSMNRSVS